MLCGPGAALDDEPPLVDLFYGFGGVKERRGGDGELIGVTGDGSDGLGERGPLRCGPFAAEHGDAPGWAVSGGEDHGGGHRPVLAVVEGRLGAFGGEQPAVLLDRVEVGLLKQADGGSV